MRVRGLFAFVVAVALLGSALLFLDFRLAASQSRAEQQAATMRSGTDVAPSQAANARGLRVAVVGEDRLSRAVGRELMALLGSDQTFGEVTFLAAVPDGVGAPALVLEPQAWRVTWTPVYSTARLRTSVAYASNGDLGWRGQKPIVMRSEAGGALVLFEGDLLVEDTTRGLVSRPGYDHHLAAQIAIQARDALLKGPYAPQP